MANSTYASLCEEMLLEALERLLSTDRFFVHQTENENEARHIQRRECCIDTSFHVQFNYALGDISMAFRD